MSRIAFVIGRFIRQDNVAINIEDRGYQFSDGVYEVIAVFNGMLVDSGLHFDRLENSLAELKITPPFSRMVLSLIMKRVIRRNCIDQGFLYLQITRGVAPRNHAYPTVTLTPSVVVMARHKRLPTLGDINIGAKIVTVLETRWSRPEIKTISLLPNVLAKQEAFERGAFEAWFVDQKGNILEGASTNAWIVIGANELVTHPLNHAILAGITRQSLINIAREKNFLITERPFNIKEAINAKEAFLTSTTSFVMPVVSINGNQIGSGRCGKITAKLFNYYNQYLNRSTKHA